MVQNSLTEKLCAGNFHFTVTAFTQCRVYIMHIKKTSAFSNYRSFNKHQLWTMTFSLSIQSQYTQLQDISLCYLSDVLQGDLTPNKYVCADKGGVWIQLLLKLYWSCQLWGFLDGNIPSLEREKFNLCKHVKSSHENHSQSLLAWPVLERFINFHCFYTSSLCYSSLN